MGNVSSLQCSVANLLSFHYCRCKPRVSVSASSITCISDFFVPEFATEPKQKFCMCPELTWDMLRNPIVNLTTVAGGENLDAPGIKNLATP